ncbi:MAG: CPBP family intramembrane metalloprotease [Spirochaetes bacterium]|nr:CPBP family intramembrane metalloprotease [Spirochaetota bacterium]
MREIIGYFRAYWRDERHPLYLLCATLFIAFSLFVNYGWHFEGRAISSIESCYGLFLFYMAFFSFPYAVSMALHAAFHRERGHLRDPGFYLLSLIIVAGLAFEASTDIGPSVAGGIAGQRYAHLFALCVNNLMQALLWFIPAFCYWYVRDRGRMAMYGFMKKGFPLYPYALMLLALAPLVVFFSGGGDFLRAYPRYALSGIPADAGNAGWLFLFETCYGLAYVSVELYFRGFMVMALRRYLGHGAIVPMAVVYCYIHFQKPFMEALSSFFGGMILGVISCYGGSIYGGIIVHLGTAWMMEAAALWRLQQ